MSHPSHRTRTRVGGRTCVAVLVILGTIGVAVPARAVVSYTAFTLDSQPGEPLLHGKTFTFTSDNATIGLTGDANTFQLTAEDVTDSFAAIVAPPIGGALVEGNTYATTRMPDPTLARLDISGDGVGCNTSNGSITVHQFTTDAGGAITALAITYEQHCEGLTPAFFGELRYQSSTGYNADTVDPYALDFGDHPLTPTDPLSVTVTNTGTSALVLGTAAIAGDAAGDYAITADTCSGTSPVVGATCSLSVVLTPTAESVRSATLAMSSNTAHGAVEVALTGTGTKVATQVSLKTSASKVDFKHSVTVTAHLSRYQDTVNKEVKIFEQPFGDAKTLVRDADVDSSGNVSIKVSLTKKTSFSATFDGDTLYEASKSGSQTVSVFPLVKATMINNYGRSGKYKLFHYTSRCPSAHRGCPAFSGAVAPNHAGRTVSVTLQLFVKGAWRTAFARRWRLDKKSQLTITFIYGDPSVIGYNSRAHLYFLGDGDHLAQSSPWSYFRITR